MNQKERIEVLEQKVKMLERRIKKIEKNYVTGSPALSRAIMHTMPIGSHE